MLRITEVKNELLKVNGVQYLVRIKRINNDVNGNSRFNCIIINLNSLQESKKNFKCYENFIIERVIDYIKKNNL